MAFYFPVAWYVPRQNGRPLQGMTKTSTHNYEPLVWYQEYFEKQQQNPEVPPKVPV